MRNWWPGRTSRVRCLRTMQLIQQYLDGTLDDRPALRVADHLDACRRCGLEAEVFSQIKAALSRYDGDVDPGAMARLRDFANDLVDRDGRRLGATRG